MNTHHCNAHVAPSGPFAAQFQAFFKALGSSADTILASVFTDMPNIVSGTTLLVVNMTQSDYRTGWHVKSYRLLVGNHAARSVVGLCIDVRGYKLLFSLEHACQTTSYVSSSFSGVRELIMQLSRVYSDGSDISVAHLLDITPSEETVSCQAKNDFRKEPQPGQATVPIECPSGAIKASSQPLDGTFFFNVPKGTSLESAAAATRTPFDCVAAPPASSPSLLHAIADRKRIGGGVYTVAAPASKSGPAVSGTPPPLSSIEDYPLLGAAPSLQPQQQLQGATGQSASELATRTVTSPLPSAPLVVATSPTPPPQVLSEKSAVATTACTGPTPPPSHSPSSSLAAEDQSAAEETPLALSSSGHRTIPTTLAPWKEAAKKKGPARSKPYSRPAETSPPRLSSRYAVLERTDASLSLGTRAVRHGDSKGPVSSASLTGADSPLGKVTRFLRSPRSSPKMSTPSEPLSSPATLRVSRSPSRRSTEMSPGDRSQRTESSPPSRSHSPSASPRSHMHLDDFGDMGDAYGDLDSLPALPAESDENLEEARHRDPSHKRHKQGRREMPKKSPPPTDAAAAAAAAHTPVVPDPSASRMRKRKAAAQPPPAAAPVAGPAAPPAAVAATGNSSTRRRKAPRRKEIPKEHTTRKADATKLKQGEEVKAHPLPAMESIRKRAQAKGREKPSGLRADRPPPPPPRFTLGVDTLWAEVERFREVLPEAASHSLFFTPPTASDFTTPLRLNIRAIQANFRKRVKQLEVVMAMADRLLTSAAASDAFTRGATESALDALIRLLAGFDALVEETAAFQAEVEECRTEWGDSAVSGPMPATHGYLMDRATAFDSEATACLCRLNEAKAALEELEKLQQQPSAKRRRRQ